MNDADLAKSLSLGCRILAEQGIIDAFGHLSARIPGEPQHYMINRGMSPALAVEKDFVVCDGDGKVVRGDGHPNGEWPIHAAIYRARPDVQSILHSHSKMSRIFSLSQRRMRGLLTSNAPEWQGGLPVYRTPGLITSMQRGEEVAEVLCDNCAMLLRGHGDVVVGASVRLTVLKAIALRQNEEVVHELISHGGEIDLWTDEELEKWKAPDFKISDDAKSALNDRVWDYYVARATDSIPKARRE